jgi:hypothetical protein
MTLCSMCGSTKASCLCFKRKAVTLMKKKSKKC